MSLQLVKEILLSSGVLGPAFYSLIVFLATVVSPLSSVPLWPLALFFWGFPLAAFYTIVGSIAGATANFWLARRFGRPLIEKLVGKRAIRLVDQIGFKAGLRTLIILRLVPSGLFDYVSYAAGLTSLAFLPYFLITVFYTVFWQLLTFRFMDQFLLMIGTKGYLAFGYFLIALSLLLIWLGSRPKFNWDKIHRVMFKILLLFLPVQLGRHFWPEFSYVMGLRIDYLSPTIYLTDLLLALTLFFWFLGDQEQWLKKVARFQWQKLILPIAVLLFLITNSFLALNQGAAFYRLLKIGELALLGVYLALNNYSLAQMAPFLSLGVGYSFILALAQFWRQSSLNGIFWWLGERTFSVTTPGIAKIDWAGRLLMRPYATFPHPNVLAGFTLVVSILVLPAFWKKNRAWAWSYGLIAFLTLLISFSRAAWLVSFLLLSFYFLKRKKLAASFLSFAFFKQTSFTQRWQLNQIALEMIKQKPLLGVGLNNFIVKLSQFWQGDQQFFWLQPVHNLYLLVGAELGLVGLALLTWALFLTFRRLAQKKNWSLTLALSAILLLGFFDHYWLTLQQTQLLLALVFGFSWQRKND